MPIRIDEVLRREANGIIASNVSYWHFSDIPREGGMSSVAAKPVVGNLCRRTHKREIFLIASASSRAFRARPSPYPH
jgi:hypothetical protein